MKKILSHWSIAFITLIALTYIGLQDPWVKEILRLKSFDYVLQNEEKTPSEAVTIVTIDEAAIEEHGQWPWDRDVLANLILQLRNAETGIIVMPILFSEEDRFGSDDVFCETLTYGTVIAQTGTAQKRTSNPVPRGVAKIGDPLPYLYEWNGMVGPLPKLAECANGVGVINTAPEIDGVVTYGGIKRGNREVTIQSKEGISKKYLISLSKHILVQDGDFVRAGTPLSDGSITPQDILSIEGISAVQNYIVNGIQEVYRLQGVKINDKHIEVIIKQMMQKVAVIESGDTMFLEGSAVDKMKFKEQNDMLYDKRVVTDPGDSNEVKAGEILTLRKLRDLNSSLKRKDMKAIEVREALTATSGPLLQGITKASLGTYSFMSAASFQETTKVLNEAAIAGKVDEMLGLKENVIVGHLIPAGTGLRSYEDLVVGSQEEYDMLKAAKEDVSEKETSEVAE